MCVFLCGVHNCTHFAFIYLITSGCFHTTYFSLHYIRQGWGGVVKGGLFCVKIFTRFSFSFLFSRSYSLPEAVQKNQLPSLHNLHPHKDIEFEIGKCILNEQNTTRSTAGDKGWRSAHTSTPTQIYNCIYSLLKRSRKTGTSYAEPHFGTMKLTCIIEMVFDGLLSRITIIIKFLSHTRRIKIWQLFVNSSEIKFFLNKQGIN